MFICENPYSFICDDSREVIFSSVILVASVVRYLFWIWLILLIVLNTIPLGNETNRSLSGNKILTFRLDYLLHSIMILVFGWIWLVGKILNVRWFDNCEELKYSSLVIIACMGLELFQLLIPWRSFNPIDMMYNIVGGILTAAVIWAPLGIRS